MTDRDYGLLVEDEGRLFSRGTRFKDLRGIDETIPKVVEGVVYMEI